MPALDTDAYTADFAAFIQASPTSYHAAAEVARRLEEAGFERLDETAEWPATPGRRVIVRDGAVIAWVSPADADAATPFRILGAHTDSPSFKLKPNPTSNAEGLLQAGVEVYGGPLLNSWLDRELELAGRVVTADGAIHLVRTGPMLRIPQLAIHLDREVNSKGLTLDRQRHTQPIWGAAADLDGDADLLAVALRDAGIESGDVAGHDLLLADTQPPARFGLAGAFFAAGRMDNLSSVLRRTRRVARRDPTTPRTSVCSRRSTTRNSARSRARARAARCSKTCSCACRPGSGPARSSRRRVFAASWILSSDAGHAVHPELLRAARSRQPPGTRRRPAAEAQFQPEVCERRGGQRAVG